MKVTLEEVCEKASSNIAQKDLEGLSGDYPIYGASGYIKNVDFYHQEKDYIAIVKDGAGVGRTMYLPAKSSVIGTLQYILPKDNVISKYLYYAVKHMKLERYYMGAAIPHIYFKDYRKEVFELPNKEEQKKIVKILETTERIIIEYEKQLEELDNLIKSRFVEMFGEPLHPVCYKKLGEIALLERGRFSPRPRNDPKYFNGNYPFIQTGDISSSEHRLVNYKQTLNELGVGVSKQFLKGTIVMAIVGATIGATAILERDVYAPDSVIGITPFKYNNIFLETLLQFWQPELLANAPECARPNINLSILEKVPIVDTDIEFQNQFADFVNQVTKLKFEVKKSLDELQTLMDSQMQEYFG